MTDLSLLLSGARKAQKDFKQRAEGRVCVAWKRHNKEITPGVVGEQSDWGNPIRSKLVLLIFLTEE